LSLGVSLFFFLAVLLAGWGLLAGVTVSALAGLIYLFMGVAFGGLAWGLKSHFETRAEPDPLLQQQQDQQQTLLETELQSVRRDLQTTDPRGAISDADPLAGTRQAAAELARLAELAHVERHSGHLRQRFRRLTRRLKVARQQYRVDRAHWHEQLTQLGLEPSDDVEEVLQSWARLGSVAREQQLLTEIIRRGEVLCELWRAVEADAAQLALRLPGPPLNSHQLLQQFDHWRQLLADWQAERVETRAARLRNARLHRRFHRTRKQLEQLDAARELLWQHAGTSDRQGFLAAAGQFERRGELLAREAELHALLQRLEQTHTATPAPGSQPPAAALPAPTVALAGLAPEPDTAAPEAPLPDDLDAIVELLRQVDADLAQAHRDCATLRADLDQLAAQPDAEEARCTAARLAEREQQLLDQLAGLDLAGQLFDQQLLQFEARHQPETLELASRYLASLTGDRFRRVWTALGERRLQVEDAAGDSFPVEALSRGGREQLYLALRLALIERLHAQGVEMPLLLDDVFSNFDEARSHNAIDVLLDFARRGHQVVYITCHQQLARQFEDRGQHTVWLAGPPAADQPSRLVG
ncbi:MAG: ATP-binding protein, partial [Planctomycetaceae bacterium]